VTLDCARRPGGGFSLLIVVSLLLACGGGSAASGTADGDQRVHLETRVTTEHYPVRGLDTQAIFDQIARYGPADETGERGAGLTSARWTYSWQGKSIRGACAIQSMSISLDITVVLPQHEQESALAPELLALWLGFAEGVAAHEEVHVQVHLAGAALIKERMESLEPAPSCDALETAVSEAWSEEQAAIDARQDKFHRQEDERLRAERAPLETLIQSERRRLTSLTGELRSLNAGVDSLRAEVDALQQQINTTKSQVDLVLRAYPTSMPPDVFSRYQALSQQYASQVDRHNRKVDEYNALVMRQGPLQDQVQQLQARIGDLVEAFNWTR
jgi:predicted secreted Zn-dependent protease